MVVKRYSIVLLMMLLTACGSQTNDRLAELQSQLDDIQAKVDDCQKAQTEFARLDGKEPLSESDVAEAKYADKISKKHEWEIRGEKAASDGLLPSQENGWKEEIKASGVTAQKNIPYQQQEANRARDAASEACKDQLHNLSIVDKIKREITSAGGSV